MIRFVVLFSTLILGCSDKKDNIASQTVQVDTLQFGSYYGTTLEEVWGKYHFRTTTGEEIAWFPNDTTFEIKVELEGLKEYPLKVVSMNKNIAVTPLEGRFNSFKLEVHKQIQEQDEFDAKLAIMSDTTEKIYVYQQRDWADSLESKYEEQLFRMDTIAKENIKIKERVLTPR